MNIIKLLLVWWKLQFPPLSNTTYDRLQQEYWNEVYGINNHKYWGILP